MPKSIGGRSTDNGELCHRAARLSTTSLMATSKDSVYQTRAFPLFWRQSSLPSSPATKKMRRRAFTGESASVTHMNLNRLMGWRSEVESVDPAIPKICCGALTFAYKKAKEINLAERERGTDGMKPAAAAPGDCFV